MSSDKARILELEAKVRQLQGALSQVGQKADKKGQKPLGAGGEQPAAQRKEKEKEKEAAPAKEDSRPAALSAAATASSSSAAGERQEKPEKRGNKKLGSMDETKEAAGGKDADGEERGAGASHNSNAKVAPAPKVAAGSSRLALFDHLPMQKALDSVNNIDSDRTLHLAVVKLGSMYRAGVLREDDDRAAALVTAFCAVIQDYSTPPNKSLSWDLDKYVRLQVQHLVDCRALCAGMGNVIKTLRTNISKVPPDMDEASAKRTLVERLHSFFEDRMIFARESIGKRVAEVIHENDTVLTFGSSPLLRQVLLAVAATKRFRLIVIDTRPLNDGMRTLRACSPYMSCVYTPLSGAAKVMGEATRVLLSASCMLSNGSMFAPAGTAVVASLAKMKNVPVIAVCESYKFSERVQLDSIVSNELGSTREIAVSDGAGGCVAQLNSGYYGAANKADNDTLPYNVINLRYDCTPIGNISAVATEIGLIPATSVPVLLRELRGEMERSGAEPEK